MKVWITKYALSSGIFEAEAELSKSCEGMIKLTREGRFPELFHGEGKEWHKTKEAAAKRASQMAGKKIISLQSQINKLAKMEF